MWQNFPATDRQAMELTAVFHRSANLRQLTTTQGTVQKSYLHSLQLVFSLHYFACLSHSFVKFSPSSALPSNGNGPSVWFVCCPSGWGNGDQSISKLKRQNIGKLTYPVSFLILLIVCSKTWQSQVPRPLKHQQCSEPQKAIIGNKPCIKA